MNSVKKYVKNGLQIQNTSWKVLNILPIFNLTVSCEFQWQGFSPLEKQIFPDSNISFIWMNNWNMNKKYYLFILKN